MSLLPAFGAAVECTEIKFGELDAITCALDVREERLQLFHSDDKGRPLKSFRALELLLEEREEQLVFGMNAGMFHADYSPVGLLVIDGKEIQSLNLADGEGNFFLKPNGVFLLSAEGVHIVESSEYPRLPQQAVYATQSGPLLLRDGSIHPSFIPQSNSRYVRNGIGIIDNHHVVFAITDEPVSFHEFAVLFRDRLGCKTALYLDGSVSSLFAANLGRRDSMHSFGPMLAVTKPLPARQAEVSFAATLDAVSTIGETSSTE